MQQPCSEYNDSCSAIVRQTVDIALPISLMPSVDLGNVKIVCCGDPHVECCEAEKYGGGLTLKITQTVTYKIPVEYSVEATAGVITSDCKKATPIAICQQGRY